MRFLFLGDIVGAPGVNLVRRAVPGLRERERLDFVVANAENATHGSGMCIKDYHQLRASGIDAITMGDHIYKKFAIAEVLADEHQPVAKPANFPAEAPGRECVRFRARDTEVAVISLLGRTYMRPVDCPFAAVDRVLASLPAGTCVVVDIHAEATADKYQLAHYLDGRVAALLGTHTHVPTADEQVLPGGTAFQCDVGMCGPYAGVLGRRHDRVLHTARTFEPTSFDVATGDVRLAGALVEWDEQARRAVCIRRLMLREADLG